MATVDVENFFWGIISFPAQPFYLIILMIGGVSPPDIDADQFVFERDIFLLFYSLVFWVLLVATFFLKKTQSFFCKFKHIKVLGFIVNFYCICLLFISLFRKVSFFVYQEDCFFLMSFFLLAAYIFLIRYFKNIARGLIFFFAIYALSYFLYFSLAAAYYFVLH